MTQQAIDQSMAVSELDRLAFAYQCAKNEEYAAKKKREEYEAQILALVTVEDEGTAHTETEFYKITTTGKKSRSIDQAALSAVQERVPEAIFNRVITYKPGIDLKQLRYIESNEPEIYSALAEAITVKPGKPTLKITEAE